MIKTHKLLAALLTGFLLFALLPFGVLAEETVITETVTETLEAQAASTSEGELKITPHLTVLNLTDNTTATLKSVLSFDDKDDESVNVNWKITMQASIDGKMDGVIKITSLTTDKNSISIMALSAGTATIEATYGEKTNKAMIMVETPSIPTPPATDIPDSTGKLVINPRLTILDLNSKPNDTVEAYMDNEPVKATWEITMHASVDGIEVNTIALETPAKESETATIRGLTCGTATVKATYKGKSVMAMVMIERIEAEDVESTGITVTPDSVILSTIGTKTTDLTATVTPAEDTTPVTWSSNVPTVVEVEALTNRTARLTATGTGFATITASINGLTTDIDVVVNDSPILASDYTVSSANPDYYTVSVRPVANPAVVDSINIAKVSIFTWSDDDQADMDCKPVTESVNGVYSYTFPVNNNTINNYYFDADTIKIHVYATENIENDGNMIAASSYDWTSSVTEGNVAYIAYLQDTGFDQPTVTSGAAGQAGSGKQIEGLRISSTIEGVTISASVHAADIGWMPFVADGVYTGTMDQNRQIESIKLTLSGTNASQYTLQYRVYQEGIGWSEWVGDGQEAGVTGQALQIEAFEVQLF